MTDERPKTRGDCKNGPRPCRRISCKHHMVWGFYHKRPWPEFTNDQMVDLIFSLSDTCTLDVADRGEHTLREIGDIIGVTRECIRQTEGYVRTRDGKPFWSGALPSLRKGKRRKCLEKFTIGVTMRAKDEFKKRDLAYYEHVGFSG